MIPFCSAALLIASALYPILSSAAEINISSKTYFLFYQREVAGGEKLDFAPAYEYLSADAGRLGGSSFSFHFYGWGRQDLREETGNDKTSGELGSAYLQYLHPTGNNEMRLGRFFLTEGAASEIVDGLFFKVRTPVGLGLSAFGGVPAEATITSTETGDSIYGGRVFYARPGLAEIGVSYLVESGEFQGDDRKEIGGDLWLRPVGFLELIGRATYNDSTGALAYQRYLLRFSPVSAVNLSLGYDSYDYKDHFQTALNPAFIFPAIDNTDSVSTVSAVLDFEAVKGFTVTLGGKSIRHDAASVGDANRGELGVKYAYNEHRDAAGVSAAVVDADLEENSYGEYRGYVTYSPGKWRFTLDGLTHQYKQAINGTKKAYYVVASAGYRPVGILRLSGDLTYTKSPQFDEDYAGLVRVSLDLGFSTDGGKPAPAAPEAAAPAPAPVPPPAPKPVPPPTPKPVAPPAPMAAPAPPVKPAEEKRAPEKAPPVAGAADPVAAYLDRMELEIGTKFPGWRPARRGEILEFTLSSDFLFGVGKTEMKPAALPSMAALADILKRYPETLVTVEGHTDSSGKTESNQELSEKRARSVFDSLVRNGVHALRISMRAYGERYPVSVNSTPEGRSANRRIQVKIRPDANLKARQGQGR
jgi:outer membrane protein OmpA-like peptidoglycan-associated protein